jgi:hypothetical protein
MQTNITCVNCGKNVQSNFCPECGQSTKVLPITWKGLITELSSRWLGMDNRFARTFVNLSLRPARVINEYLAGNRVKYIGPLSYLVVMSALYLLSFGLFSVSPEEFMDKAVNYFDTMQLDENPEIAKRQLEFMDAYMRIFSNNMRVLVGAMIPFLAMGLAIFYREKNYLEYFLLATYATTHMLWVSIILLGIFAWTGSPLFVVSLVTSIGYFAWIVSTIHAEGNILWRLFRALLCWSISYILFVLFMAVVALVTVIVILI